MTRQKFAVGDTAYVYYYKNSSGIESWNKGRVVKVETRNETRYPSSSSYDFRKKVNLARVEYITVSRMAGDREVINVRRNNRRFILTVEGYAEVERRNEAIREGQQQRQDTREARRMANALAVVRAVTSASATRTLVKGARRHGYKRLAAE